MTEAIFRYLDSMIKDAAFDDFLDRRLVTRAEWADRFAQEEYFDLWGEHHGPLEIVEKDKLILILGEAGSGKTTLLRHISNCQANSCLDPLKTKGQVTLPIYVNFSRFQDGCDVECQGEVVGRVCANSFDTFSCGETPEKDVDDGTVDIYL